MRLVERRLVPYRLPLARPYTWARGTQTERIGLLVALGSDAGVVGWGEIAPPPDEAPDPQGMHDAVQRILDAVEPCGVEAFVDAVDRARPGPRVRCALVTAALDAAARAGGWPLAVELGRRAGAPDAHTEVPVNALVGSVGPREAVAQAVAAVRDGFGTIKVKSDGNVRRDADRLAAVRQAVGDDVALRLDPNGSWAAADALGHLIALAGLDLEYVEQPVADVAVDALARLRERSPIPLAWDESVTSVAKADRLAADGAADVLVLKPQRLGGPDRVVAAAQAARRHGIDSVVTNSLETAVGRAAALHAALLLTDPVRACGLATETYLAKDVDMDAARSEGGRMRRAEAAGLGVDPEMAAGATRPLGGP